MAYMGTNQPLREQVSYVGFASACVKSSDWCLLFLAANVTFSGG